jgi:cytochrome P450
MSNSLNSSNSSVVPYILGAGCSIDPYPVYERLRQKSAVHRDASGLWFISTHAAVARAARSPPGELPTIDTQ